jgi:hypothetical protein
MRGNIYMPCEVILQESLDRPTGRNHPKSSYPLTNHQPCENCAGYCYGDQYAFGHIITVTQQNTQVSMQGELQYELASCAWNTRRPITVACAPYRSHGLLPKSPVSVRLPEYAHRSASHALHSPNSILQTQGTLKDHAAVPHDRISPESPCIQAFFRPGSRPRYYSKWSNARSLPSTHFSCMVIFR